MQEPNNEANNPGKINNVLKPLQIVTISFIRNSDIISDS